jgi:hypothetical protein
MRGIKSAMLIFITSSLFAFAGAAPVLAGPLGLAAGIGPLVGLDMPLRGGGLEAGLRFQPAELGGEIRLGGRYDAGLSAFSGTARARLLLGPDIAVSLGAELPFGSASILETKTGARVYLVPVSWLSSFSIDAILLELSPAEGRRPRAAIAASLSWSAYRAASILSGTTEAARKALQKELAGLRGFEAGFRATIALELSWGGP